MTYKMRARQLMLSPAESIAFIALNTYADAHGKCPSCGARVSRQESDRTTHARHCDQLIADAGGEINGNGEGDSRDPRIEP